MRITHWSTKSKDDPTIEFVSESPVDQRNWITAFIGRNGTKKSLLLRLLLEAGLRNSIFRHGSHPSIRPFVQVAGASAPFRVIAIAGTPFDRFPRQTLYQRTANPTKFDVDEAYIYLGMKAANGTMGAAHSLRTLAFLLLNGLVHGRAVGKPALEILDFLGLDSSVTVELRRHSSLNASRKDPGFGIHQRVGDFVERKFAQKLQELEKLYGNSSILDSKMLEFLKSISTRSGDQSSLEMLSALPAQYVFTFDAQGGVTSSSVDKLGAEHLLLLIRTGLVVPNRILVKRRNTDSKKEFIQDSDLSSGQWHVMSSLLGLVLSVGDNSLILVDEPENSLHPDWQRAYVDLLTRVLSAWKGCHIVLATHSPLIASGIEPGKGNVVRLVQDARSPLGVSTKLVELTYGWEASDVYQEAFGLESTRVTSFIGKADRALALITEGDDAKDELATIAGELRRAAALLPERDVMRSIINAISQVAKEEDRRA